MPLPADPESVPYADHTPVGFGQGIVQSRPVEVPSIQTNGATSGAAGIPEQTRAAMRALSASFAGLFASLPFDVKRPSELMHALGIDRPLASRLWRLAGAEEPAEAAALLPTVNQMRATVRAAEAAGADAAAVSTARAAVSGFDDFLRTHADHLGQFEAMVARAAGALGQTVLTRHRRAAVKANGAVWGFHVASAAKFCIFFEGREPDQHNIVSVTGFAGFQSLRTDSPLELQTSFRYTPTTTSHPEGLPDSNRKVVMQPPTLISDHSTGPTPRLMTVQDEDGFLVTRIHLPAFGKSNAASFFLEHDAHEIGRGEPTPAFRLGNFVAVPAESLQLDMWVPAGWSDPATLTAAAYACAHAPDKARRCRDADLVEVNPTIQHLGRFTEPQPTPEIRQWSRVIAHVLDKHGLAGRTFDVYRCRVQYPILHSAVRLSVRAADPHAPCTRNPPRSPSRPH